MAYTTVEFYASWLLRESPEFVENFVHAIEIIYSTTAGCDRRLHDIVVAALHSNPTSLDDPSVQRALRDIPNLAYDLVMYFHRKQDEQ